MAVDNQPLLFSEGVYKGLEKPKMRGPLMFTTIDGTPSYDDGAIMDSMKVKLGNPSNLKFSVPSHSSTPLDLIQSRDADFYMMRVGGDAMQRSIESVCALRIGNDDINVMLDSPIKAIAWTLFLKATKQINNEDARININFTKTIIGRLGYVLREQAIPKTEVLHIVRIVDSKNYKGMNFEHFNREQMELLHSRVRIFNGCLQTSAKIYATETGEDIVYTR